MTGVRAEPTSTAARILAWGVPRLMVVAAVIAFALPAATLAARASAVGGAPWATVLVPLGVWGLAWALRPPWRSAAQALAMLAMVPAAMLVADPAGGPWLMSIHVAGAVVVSAALALAWRAAVVIVLLAAAVEAAAAFGAAGTGVVPTTSSNAVLDVAYVATVGIGLAVVRRSWIAAMDDRDRSIEALRDHVAREHADAAEALGTLEGERRIHETLLNTLSALAAGVDPEHREAARRAAGQTAGQVMVLDQAAPRSLTAALAAASASVAEVSCALSVDGDVALAPEVGTALRDAVVESLRNVARHSGVHEASVCASARRLRVEVVDEGTGIGAEADRRFGLEQAIDGGMRAVGGRACVSARPPRGTRVVLELPGPVAVAAPPSTAGATLLDAWRSRVGLVAASGLLAVAIWPFATRFDRPVLAAVPVFAAATGPFVLSSVWHRPAVRRRVAISLVVIACLALLAAAAAGPQGCNAATAVDWIVGILCAVGALLPFLATRSPHVRAGGVVALAGCSAVLVLQLPADCRVRPTASIIAALAYLVLALWLLAWLESSFDRQGLEEHARWEELVRDRSQTQRQRAALVTLGRVSGSVRGLVAEVADGSLDPASADVAGRAQREADALRRTLRGLDEPPPVELTGGLRSVEEVAVSARARLDAVVLDPPQRSDSYPPAILQGLAGLLGERPGTRIRAVLSIDADVETVVVTVPTPVRDVVVPDRDRDCVVDVVESDSEATVVIERPAYGTSPSSRAT